MKCKRLIAAVGLPLSIALALAGCAGKSAENVISLKDNGVLLTNPDMGYNFTYYANTIYDFNTTLAEGDFLDDFPCETVFFRIGWNWIEPEEGQFNWEFTDKVADEWIAHGKRVAFCWVVAFPGDQSTPLWVKDAGAQGTQYGWYERASGDPDERYFGTEGKPTTLTLDGIPQDAQDFTLNRGNRNDPNYNGGQEVERGDFEHYRGSWIPDYEDEVFLEKWENFLSAAAARYDNNEHVEFIEIGSFGDWGEGHNSYTPGNPITPTAKRTHIALYLKYFKNVQLMVNDEVVRNTGLVDYVKENGIGLSDHTVQVPYPQYPGEGAPGNKEYAEQFYKEQPVLLENHNGTTFRETYYKSVNECHATWARINCNPYIAKSSEFTDLITLRLGYRLTFTEVSFGNLKAGKKVTFTFKMKNSGAAPCYRGGNPTFCLVDSLGRVAAEATSEFNVKDLPVALTTEDAEVLTGEATMELPKSLVSDTYYIVVSVREGGEDRYALPLDHRDGSRNRYRIAQFEV